METPFTIGERVHADQLLGWEYVGLSGKSGRNKHSVGRFKKGGWVMELRAKKTPGAPARVVSIRALAEDSQHWVETRARLMRHKRQRS